MPEGYETETERVRKRLRETLTPKEKFINFWDYNKKYVWLGLAALVIVGILAFEALQKPRADYTVCWVSATELDSGSVERITDALAAYGEDLNGDGRVHVELHRISLDLGLILDRGGSTEGEKEQANLMALEADLNIFQSGIYLTDNPEALQKWTGALCYADGTVPEAGAEDWENMAVSWRELPGLGEMPVDGEFYLALRGCWNEEQRNKWERALEFWRAILEGGAEK